MMYPHIHSIKCVIVYLCAEKRDCQGNRFDCVSTVRVYRKDGIINEYILKLQLSSLILAFGNYTARYSHRSIKESKLR